VASFRRAFTRRRPFALVLPFFFTMHSPQDFLTSGFYSLTP
jgi:hypothetical protein